MRKGPLSNKDKEFIADNLNLTAAELAGKLERSEKSVESYMASIPPENKGDTHTMEMYGRNKKYGVVVMTENASMFSDENKSKTKDIYETRKYRGAIHRIRSDEQ